MWHEATKDARNGGQLILLGVIQEQHAERCRLFAQWKRFEWPIVHDPINLLGAQAVPIFVALDEAGIVVDESLQISELPAFLARKPNSSISPADTPTVPTLEVLEEQARKSNTAANWLAAGDHAILWSNRANSAVEYYTRAGELNPSDAAVQFRLGVAHRMRYDSPAAQKEDFQAAVDSWGRALDLNPNHYIYRRRIQQYGPRLTKPYPFYDWVAEARRDIVGRGGTPISLRVEPMGAEIAQPSKSFDASTADFSEPDRDGQIARDSRRLVETTSILVPGKFAKGESVRVHIQFRLSRISHWNNEAEPLRVWIDAPAGWKVDNPLLTAPQPIVSESRETRVIEFELQSPEKTNVEAVKAYALYNVCEDAGGQCLYLRQDITLPIRFTEAR